MAITLLHKDLRIQIFDDSAFNQTADSPTSYDKVIQADKDKQYSSISQHAIKIYRDNNLISSAIILATGGGTGVHSDTALIDENNLIIRCCNKLFSLTLPELTINWMAEPDLATCFSIHKYQNSYITHGETSIARIDKNGNIIWSYGGADIFVRLYDGNPFEMHETYIELMDFNGSIYKIDYNGETIDHQESDYYKQQPVTVYLKPKKPWWKFWA
ncbi:hypothetical protein ESA94_17365 [Lacibacter luteus]|uniref:Uncharacterized protein n=1 Tax=Lacibacter luteus TaxID=2508719 RepID=A0A4Q1CEU1_9BACT|nr:hypothetical protein [Lacibacter luteus]RXK58408.1 hypothetical protein ESA94_17365 [Lacibacter luteus]